MLLTWALLTEAAGYQAHFTDTETEPEQASSPSGLASGSSHIWTG